MKKDLIKAEAEVLSAERGGRFKLKLTMNDMIITGFLGGSMRKNFIKVVPGDKVDVEISTYDLTKGRIVFRHKSTKK